MPKIGLIQRDASIQWGGDLIVTSYIKEGLQALNHSVFSAISTNKLPTKCDFVFFFNIFLPQKKGPNLLQNRKIPYGFIAMHLDFPKFRKAETGMFLFFFHLLSKQPINGHLPDLEDILKSPKWIYLFAKTSPMNFFDQLEIYENASLIVANSPKEKKIIEESYPSKCPTISTYWSIPKYKEAKSSVHPFLQRTGLSKGEYFLQIGRCGSRKNQLATIIALRNHKAPLVLISMANSIESLLYIKLCANASNQFREAPTYFITDETKFQSEGNFHIISTGSLLSNEEIGDAYQNAYMYIHPAFYECPGFIYLEAARANIPVVASEWSTLQDYCSSDPRWDESLNGRISYCIPYDIPSIENAIATQEKRVHDKSPLNHSIFNRRPVDMARDISKELDIILS